MKGSFEKKYPNVADWVVDGWVEIGSCDWTKSFIRILDEGGMLWEGNTEYESVDDAFADAERVLVAWNKGELNLPQ